MAEPLTLALIAGGLTVGSKIYDHFRTRDLNRLQNEVLNQHAQFNKDLARRARGKFTDAELASIRTAAEPQINAAAANVAARLGVSSPAGVALISQAQQAPILAAQQAATAAYAPSLTALSKAVKEQLGQLSGDKSFVGDLKAISEAYKILKELGGTSNKQSGKVPNNPSGALGNLEETALDMLIGQGYQKGMNIV